MEEIQQQEVTNRDVYKHYLSSIFIYGLILLIITFCPGLTESIEHEFCNYIIFFIAYYVLYIILALPIFLWLKPKSILQSRTVKIIDYFKRWFKKTETTQEWLKNIEPDENEKQAFAILFIKAFFGVTCVNILCNKYILSLDYNFHFLMEMFSQAVQYGTTNGASFGFMQYIYETADMWGQLFVLVITLVLAVSYLTEFNFLKNKIKWADTTPLGIISCIMCYAPFVYLSNKLIPVYDNQTITVDNFTLRIVLNILVVLAHFGMMLAVLRLGTKSGNLTNRGIVTGFPYNIVRHPEYAMQMLYIICATIPVMVMENIHPLGKLVILSGSFIWILVYYFRAITEERNLIKDPAYQEYTQKVKHRFIPKLL